jgi:cytochrome c553
MILSWTVALLATATATATAGGDATAGQTRSLACQACHLSSDPASQAPHLVGQRAGYLQAQLLAFKRGDRKHDLMSAIAAQLSEAEIADLAAYWSSRPPGSDATVPPNVAAIKKSPMPFPRGFPTGFVVYHSANNADQKAVSKSYVNAVALRAAKAGQPLPDGSAIVIVSYGAKLGADGNPVAASDGTWVPDKVLSYSAMEARAGWGKDVPELLRNGNWSYNLFGPDKAPRELNHAACLACHKPVAKQSYVFTLDQIRARP